MLGFIKKYFGVYKGLRKEIYVVFISRVINAMGVFVFPFLSLILTDKLGYSYTEMGFWVTVTGLLHIPSQLLGGKLTDLIGRKKIIVFADTIGGIIYILIGVLIYTYGPDHYILYLIMMGAVVMGLAESAHNALMADFSTPERRDDAYSLSYLGFNLGFVVGPSLAGLLFDNYFAWIFLGDGVTILLATLLIFIYIDDRNAENIELSDLEEKSTDSLFRVMWNRKILLLIALASIGYNYVYSHWGVIIPVQMSSYFTENGRTLYGFLASLNAFLVISLTPLITLIGRRIHGLTRMAFGGVLYFVGFGMLGFVSHSIWFYVSCIIFTIGEIIITISYMPYVTRIIPASHRGRVSSLMGLLMSIGWTAGPLLAGRLLDVTGFRYVWTLAGIIVGAATVLMYLLKLNESKFIHKTEPKEIAKVFTE